jgi:1-acyl-sn-glycerol-3-phosphate acyltransferase
VTIGKKSLRWIPIFGQIYWLAGNVLINRGNAAEAKQTMLETTETLQKRDTSIWVFAQGTRNLGKGLLPFKNGCLPDGHCGGSARRAAVLQQLQTHDATQSVAQRQAGHSSLAAYQHGGHDLGRYAGADEAVQGANGAVH